MAFDLEEFSEKDLNSLIKQATQRKKALVKRKPITQVRKQLETAAKAAGYTIAELFGTGGTTATKAIVAPGRKKAASSRKGTKVPPKYRNPGNPKDLWSGRGLPPRWMADLIKKGKKREDFLIKK